MHEKNERLSSSLRTQSFVMERAIQQAVREALLEHKRAGRPIVVWRDGKVVWVPAAEIRVNGATDTDGQ